MTLKQSYDEWAHRHGIPDVEARTDFQAVQESLSAGHCEDCGDPTPPTRLCVNERTQKRQCTTCYARWQDGLKPTNIGHDLSNPSK